MPHQLKKLNNFSFVEDEIPLYQQVLIQLIKLSTGKRKVAKIFQNNGHRVVIYVSDKGSEEGIDAHLPTFEIIDGLGDKIRSSSDITGLKEIKRDQLET